MTSFALPIKIKPCISFSFLPILLMHYVTEVGIGSSVHALLTILFSVMKHRNFYDPCKFLLGPNVIVGLVLGIIEFVSVGSSCTSQ